MWYNIRDSIEMIADGKGILSVFERIRKNDDDIFYRESGCFASRV